VLSAHFFQCGSFLTTERDLIRNYQAIISFDVLKDDLVLGRDARQLGSSVAVCVSSSDAFFLCKSKLYKAHQLRWSESIKELLDRKAWHEAFKLSIELFNQRVHQFSSYPELSRADERAAFLEVMKELLLAFLKESQTVGNSGSPLIDPTLLCTVEFLFGIADFDLLFTDARQHFVLQGRDLEYLDCIAYFVQKGLLRSVPNPECFSQLASHFKQRAALSTLSSLILNLQMNCLDLTLAVSLCLELKLFVPLMHVHSLFHKDFVTPLHKLLDEYRQLKAVPEKENEACEALHTFIQLAKLTLDGKMVATARPIEEALRGLVAKQLLVLLLEDSVCELLVSDSPALFFEIMLRFFIGETKQALQSFDANLYSFFFPASD